MFGWGISVPAMAAADVAQHMEQGQPLWILDVRTVSEFRTGHIPGAHGIPLGDLSKRLGEIPRELPIVTVCHSGARSSMAAKQLKKLGYDVYNMTGGMMRWKGRTVR